MKRVLISALSFLLIILNVSASINILNEEAQTIRVTYPMGRSGGPSASKTIMEISDGWARIYTDFGDRDSDAPVQTTYLDYINEREIKTAHLKDSESIYTTRSFKINEGLELQDETEVIAGYLCRKATTVINTNSI